MISIDKDKCTLKGNIVDLLCECGTLFSALYSLSDKVVPGDEQEAKIFILLGLIDGLTEMYYEEHNDTFSYATLENKLERVMQLVRERNTNGVLQDFLKAHFGEGEY